MYVYIYIYIRYVFTAIISRTLFLETLRIGQANVPAEEERMRHLDMPTGYGLVSVGFLPQRLREPSTSSKINGNFSF